MSCVTGLAHYEKTMLSRGAKRTAEHEGGASKKRQRSCEPALPLGAKSGLAGVSTSCLGSCHVGHRCAVHRRLDGIFDSIRTLEALAVVMRAIVSQSTNSRGGFECAAKKNRHCRSEPRAKNRASRRRLEMQFPA